MKKSKESTIPLKTKKVFGEFHIENFETDPCVFWYKHENIAAIELKEKNQFQWGLERIYFDVSLTDMEKLKDCFLKITEKDQIPVSFKYLDIEKTNHLRLKDENEITRFVANFASTKDAKKFYQALFKLEDYQTIKPDRNLDYDGYQLDAVAHYASGFRDARKLVKYIIENAIQTPNGSYSINFDGSSEKIILPENYQSLLNQYNQVFGVKETWEKTEV